MPASKLMNILNKLEPRSIARVVSDAHNMAREAFTLSKNTVSGHAEFLETITRYYRHHYAHTIAAKVVLPDDMVSSEVRNLLDRAYRDYGGYEGAYQNARTGKAGGMHAILNGIADALRQQQEQRYIDHVFYSEVDPMNYEEIVELMREYLDRFGGLLPPDYRARSPHDLARNYDTIIKSHAHKVGMLNSLIERV
jgi:hypothetical protein